VGNSAAVPPAGGSGFRVGLSTLPFVGITPAAPATTTLPNLPDVRPATSATAVLNPASRGRRSMTLWVGREERQDAARDPSGQKPDAAHRARQPPPGLQLRRDS
jgi:hypothetical protein